MDIEEARSYALSLPGTTEDMPYGDDVVVFRVENKIFMSIGLTHTSGPVLAPHSEVIDPHSEPRIAVKCQPDWAVLLRDRYRAVQPAYHENKRHWNDIYLLQDMPQQEIERWIRHSYYEVLRKLPAKIRQTYTIPPFDPEAFEDGE